TCLDLLGEIEQRVDEHDYDVALIGAGGLGVPLATLVRSRGRVGISLGGALQVLFGVFGERWHSRESWQERYFTDAWVNMPARYPAMNRGVRLSRGAFLAFLDSDDLWTPDKLELQMPLLIRNPALDLVFGHVRQFHWDEERQDPIPGMSAGTMLIRRESFDG